MSSTLAVAGLAYAKPKTRPFAGAYLLEESIEEIVEGYAGFWAFDRIWSPVRIEASLVDLRTGATIWTDRHTGLSDFRITRIFSRPKGVEKDAQFRRSIYRSAEYLAQRLRAAAN